MKQKIPFILIVLVLLSLVYTEIRNIGFAYVDDKWMLLDENLVRADHFNWAFVKKVFLRINSLQYSPLNTLYYYCIYQINGYDPYYYHLFSFVIHLMNTGLLFIMNKRILQIFKVENHNELAFSTVLIWAILPFNVESIVWISASKIPLYTFFGFISMIFFIEAYVNSNKVSYMISIFSLILSFLAKEQAVLFPLTMTAFVLCYEKSKMNKLYIRKLFSYLGPFFIMALVFGVITLYTVIYGGGSHDFDRYPFHQRIVLAFYCVAFYILNNFVPVELHYHYPFPFKLGSAVPLVYYLYLILTPLGIWLFFTVVRKYKHYPLYLFGFISAMAHLILVIQVVPLARAAIVADRYMYVSSAGLILLAVVLLNEALGADLKDKTKLNPLIVAGLVVYIFYLAFFSFNLVENWKNMQL